MEYTEEFELFWKKYPSRWNANSGDYVKRKKRPAFDKWQKLSPETRSECLLKVRYIKRAEGSASAIRDPVTWLNQAGWEDIELDEPEPAISKEMADKALPNTVKFEPVNVNNRRNEEMRKLNG